MIENPFRLLNFVAERNNTNFMHFSIGMSFKYIMAWWTNVGGVRKKIRVERGLAINVKGDDSQK